MRLPLQVTETKETETSQWALHKTSGRIIPEFFWKVCLLYFFKKNL